jgi:D-alanyl-lipoteichoic acid acyltransferase DltB (MBOAT superfamily)
MNYLSFSFALAIALAFCISIFTPRRYRWVLLLIFSLWALAALNGALLGLAVGQMFLAYVFGFWLEKTRASSSPSRGLLFLTVLVQFLPLLFFKYLSPFVQISFLKSWQQVLVPLGLSFYTFQIVAYQVDVFRGKRRAERHLGYFALFVLFFANKPAGPIEDASLIEKFRDIPFPSSAALRSALLLVALGFIKKFLIADNLDLYVEPVFKHPDDFVGLPALVAVLLAKYQVYCDFSGATDVAMGVAGLFGVTLSQNFARPFAAPSVREFWRRWHMTLQNWIRDYVFYPLLGSPFSRWGLLPLLLISFLVFGLWHGPRWTFAIYGLFQGLLVFLSSRWRPRHPEKKGSFLFSVGKFLFFYVILISLPNILFRADSLSAAWAVLSSVGISLAAWKGYPELGPLSLTTLAVLILALEAWQWWDVKGAASRWVISRPLWLRIAFALALAVCLVLFVDMDKSSPFIYSRF